MKARLKNTTWIMVMFLLTMICCSSLIYGGFTRQYNPRVRDFGISVASQENMMISSTGQRGTFSDYIKLEELVSDQEVTLSPLVGKVDKTTDETYENLILTEGGSNANTSKYMRFSLYFLGSSDMNLYLKGNTGGEVVVFDDSTADHSFTNSERARLLDNIRIAFLTYSTTYQPSSVDTTIVYSTLPIATNVYSLEVTETENYKTFNTLGYTNTSSDVILATTKKQEITKIDVVIWLEEDGLGTLEALCNLTLSLRFEAVLIDK